MSVHHGAPLSRCALGSADETLTARHEGRADALTARGREKGHKLGIRSYRQARQIHDALAAIAAVVGDVAIHHRVCAAMGLTPPHPATFVSPAEYRVLLVVSATQRLRQLDIAAALASDRSAVCRHLGRLERRGLVRRVVPPLTAGRVRTPGRHRTPWYEPTPAGHSAVEVLTLTRYAFVAWLLRGWDTADIEILATVLGRLASTIETDTVTAR